MIYCVEDDSSILELMLYTLRASGFEAQGFPDGVALFHALRHSKPRLIRLVEDIIKLSRLDEGGADMRWEEADLHSMARDASNFRLTS